MRLLAVSDIHNNLVAVRKMRAHESNRFDAIVLAGDVGNAGAPAVFDILSTFGCPIVYVLGNWDHEIDYATSFGAACQLLHLNVVTIGNLHFTGFSGCPTHWGRNPIAARCGGERSEETRQKVLRMNRGALRTTIAQAGIDPRRTVVVTHERLTRLDEIAGGVGMHLYGHVHQFSKRMEKDTAFVNVSVLDRPVTARPRAAAEWTREQCRNYNAGNYTVVEIGASDVRIECVHLPHAYPDWIALEGERYNGIAWIADEQEWTNPADPRLMRYRESRGRP